MNKSNSTATSKSNKNKPCQVFSYCQVQRAFARLLAEEADLVINDVLPPRTSLVAEIFTRMSFDDVQCIRVDSISEKQAILVTQYCH
jgi:hypothetical protein